MLKWWTKISKSISEFVVISLLIFTFEFLILQSPTQSQIHPIFNHNLL